MNIENSQLADLPKIFDLYRIATAYMKSKNQVQWPNFPEDLILNEIKENKQWKLLIDGQIACIWATTLNDELIWGSIDSRPSLYMHRITTDPNFRGQNLVQKLVSWANEYGKNKDLECIRLDTVGYNKGLIAHYQRVGFDFLGIKALESTVDLPDHYNDGEVCYFQKKIE